MTIDNTPETIWLPDAVMRLERIAKRRADSMGGRMSALYQPCATEYVSGCEYVEVTYRDGAFRYFYVHRWHEGHDLENRWLSRGEALAMLEGAR